MHRPAAHVDAAGRDAVTVVLGLALARRRGAARSSRSEVERRRARPTTIGTLLGAIAAGVAVGTIVLGEGSRSGACADRWRSSRRLPGVTQRRAIAGCARARSATTTRSAISRRPRSMLCDRAFAYAAAFGAAPLAVDAAPDRRRGRSPGMEPRRRPVARGARPLPTRATAGMAEAPACSRLAWRCCGGGGRRWSATGSPRCSTSTARAASRRRPGDWVDRGVADRDRPGGPRARVGALGARARRVPDLWQTRTVTGDVVRGRRFASVVLESATTPTYW